MANMTTAKLLVAASFLGTVLAGPQGPPFGGPPFGGPPSGPPGPPDGLPRGPPADPGAKRPSSASTWTSLAPEPTSPTSDFPLLLTPLLGESTGDPNGSISSSPPATTDAPRTTTTASTTDTPQGTPTSSTTGPPPGTTTMTEEDANPLAASSSNRTLVITLSSVLSAVALFLIIATLLACFRVKHGRLPFVLRGISPVEDEEIESWKRRAGDEKFTAAPRHASGESSPRSLRKAPSVIVYQTTGYPSADDSGGEGYQPPSRSRSLSYPHAHTLSASSAKHSLDMPPAAVLARAPNSRPGLTDDTVEGDDAFIPTHHRRHSRLSKRHTRSRSSVSSQWATATSPRHSAEGPPRTPCSVDRSGAGETRGRHARIYSDSSVPPRLSFDEEYGYVAPAVLTGVPTPESEIGRAIG